MAKKKKSNFTLTLIFLSVLVGSGFYIYQKFFASKIHLKNKNYTFIFISKNDTFEDLMNDINAENIIDDPESFEWLAKKMELDQNIDAGKYRSQG